MSILIVEDERTSAEIASQLLRKLGHKVTVVETAAAGLKALEESEPPAMVLLDWHLPDMDGPTFTKKVRERFENQPPYIIMATHAEDPDLVVAAFRSGVDDFTPKPYTAAHLWARVHSALHRLESAKFTGIVSEESQAQRALSVGVLNQTVHEISTPLTVIGFLNEELREAIHDDGVQRRLICDQIGKNVDHIRDVLRTQSEQLVGGEGTAFESLDLADVVGDAIGIMTSFFRASGVELIYDFEAINGEVHGNRTLLLQVMINMITNAIEAAQNSPDKWVGVKVQHLSDACEVRFTNSGPKLTRHEAMLLLQSPVSTKGRARGLGIRICQKILAQHGGELLYNFDSENTCFAVRLPMTLSVGLEKA